MHVSEVLSMVIELETQPVKRLDIMSFKFTNCIQEQVDQVIWSRLLPRSSAVFRG